MAVLIHPVVEVLASDAAAAALTFSSAEIAQLSAEESDVSIGRKSFMY